MIVRVVESKLTIAVKASYDSPAFVSVSPTWAYSGSVKLPRLNVLLAPSVAVWLLGAVMTGVTLLTVRLNVVDVDVVPSLAVIVTTCGLGEVGPSDGV